MDAATSGGALRAVERARAAAERAAWAEVYELLHDRDPAGLAARDHEALADAAWWLCRVEESLVARRRAYSGHAAEGDERRAGYDAWMLATEYDLLGKASLGAGWLRKAQRHLHGLPECAEQGLVAYSEAEVAELNGDLDDAIALAERAAEIGRRCGNRDVVALAIHLQGRLLVTGGRLQDGLALLDEAMIDVMAGELSDLFTGWIYCSAVAVCFDHADMRRAIEWNDAAMTWCETLPAGTPYHGLCRVHRAELIGLGGSWDRADAEADRACTELMAYHPSFAAESFYVAGEIRRRKGDLAAAEESFLRAHELGREPQPGLALLRLAQGKVEAAAGALRSCLAAGGWNPLGRARLLAAQVEVALAADDVESARTAAGELHVLGEASGATLLEALTATAQGTVHLAENDVAEALDRLRRARSLWLDLELPYEAARARMLLAAACREAGDHETARLELGAARSVFERLGSAEDARRALVLLGQGDDEQPPRGLTAREVEVLRLVAAGKTNREIADELVVSPHTVARHLNNIFAKLDVSSRSAATAFAYRHDLA